MNPAVWLRSSVSKQTQAHCADLRVFQFQFFFQFIFRGLAVIFARQRRRRGLVYNESLNIGNAFPFNTMMQSLSDDFHFFMHFIIVVIFNLLKL